MNEIRMHARSLLLKCVEPFFCAWFCNWVVGMAQWLCNIEGECGLMIAFDYRVGGWGGSRPKS